MDDFYAVILTILGIGLFFIGFESLIRFLTL